MLYVAAASSDHPQRLVFGQGSIETTLDRFKLHEHSIRLLRPQLLTHSLLLLALKSRGLGSLPDEELSKVCGNINDLIA
jgi:hypothetical protein